MDIDFSSNIKEVLAHYNIGELFTFHRDERGYINVSFAIETQSNDRVEKYFLRRYKSGIREEEIIFEHSVIDHLIAKDFSLVARVLTTREGGTYLCQDLGPDIGTQAFYAIFEFLPGEDKYTWMNPRCNPEELSAAASVLASFHHAVSDLNPRGRRYVPGIHELLPAITGPLNHCLESSRGTVFDVYLSENLDLIRYCLAQTIQALEACQSRALVNLVIHGDFHPGNLKFLDDQVVGLFDFDWSNIDIRAFDVALALFYFFATWEGEQDGHLRLGDISAFLNSYQDTLTALPDLGPLTDVELECLPHLINAASLYVLNWTCSDYCSKDVDPQEYKVYLRHSVNLLKWMQNQTNFIRLKNTLHSLEMDADRLENN